MSWIECIDPFNTIELKPHMFFRHTPDSKYFNAGDASKLCPICYDIAHSRNNPILVSNVYRTLKNPDSKPEKDSL